MKEFFAQVKSINGRAVVIPVNQYLGGREVKSMSDAAAREAMEHCAHSGDKAIVVVGTPRKTFKKFEIEVTHQVTTRIKEVRS